MNELIDNPSQRQNLLKELILQLHEGESPEAVQEQLKIVLGKVPYGDVVQVEQQLIADGLPPMEIQRLCDLHSQALKGSLDTSGVKKVESGHPVDTFHKENAQVSKVIGIIENRFEELKSYSEKDDASEAFLELRSNFNDLYEIEKHYLRKENLLFPFLEKHDIDSVPKVMWGKHDEVRELSKASFEAFTGISAIKADEANSVIDLLLNPLIQAVEEMIFKEEEILFPMCLDTLDEAEWYEIYRQTEDIGYCLYEPQDEWQPENIDTAALDEVRSDKIRLPGGNFNIQELTAFLNTLPVDVTFVDREDKVRYFSTGKERIFHRSKAIIGRKVQMCHPPSSVHIVEQILDDFKSGGQDDAAFWINLKGRFIHIEYFAVRDDKGEYLGTLEVTQDLTDKRNLEGERRLLKYDMEN